MGGKPDIIRAIVLIFAVGLVITGFTSLHTADDRPEAVNSSAVAGSGQLVAAPLNR